MKSQNRRDEILRAVSGSTDTAPHNPDRLADIVTALAEAEKGKSILRAKHYGTSGQSIDAMAGMVPEA